MQAGLFEARSRQQHQRLKIPTFLVGLILVFGSLAGCSNGNNSPHTSGVPTHSSSAVTATPAISPTATRQASPWKLVWNDEFDGPAGTPPDPAKWTPAVGGGGWGNQQLDYDTNNQNAYQDGQGNLVIEARKGNPTNYQCWYGQCQYTSGQITTDKHFSFTYGRLEARIKVPAGQGLWSAFWLLGDNCATVGWPTCGEIDVMENIGREANIIYGTVHGPGYFSGISQLKQGAFSDDFHVFALQWDPTHLYFFMDGVNYATLNRSSIANQAQWVYNHPFHIILNVSVGGTWPGSPNATTSFPQKMTISYVRVYTHI